MGMPLELNTMIVTKGNEKRMGENDFVLEKKDYRLYPLEIPIEVKKTIDSETTAMALIKKLEWENNMTTITYQLFPYIQQIKLHNKNYKTLNIKKPYCSK